jgi:hypothetical protein
LTRQGLLIQAAKPENLTERMTVLFSLAIPEKAKAGFCALINEARVKAKKSPLPFLNPLIYPLSGTACFRDITQGSNGAYEAGPGYDMVTGLGVPNVAKLIQALTK